MALRFTPTIAICAIGAAVTGALLALPPSGSSSSPGPAPAPVGSAPVAGGAAPVAIEIADFDFTAAQAAPGAIVQVTNRDGVAHTLTANDGQFDTGAVDDGTTVSFTAPATPGIYDFFCEIHPSMTGSLVVD